MKELSRNKKSKKLKVNSSNKRKKHPRNVFFGLALFSSLVFAITNNGHQDRSLSSLKIETSKELKIDSKLALDTYKTQEYRELLNRNIIPAELKNADLTIIENIKNGKMKMYSIQIIDTIHEDGDIVGVSINNLYFGKFRLTNIGQNFSMPLYPGQLHHLTVKALVDGGGGVTFGAISTQGEQFSKVMRVGDQEDWLIGF